MDAECGRRGERGGAAGVWRACVSGGGDHTVCMYPCSALLARIPRCMRPHRSHGSSRGRRAGLEKRREARLMRPPQTAGSVHKARGDSARDAAAMATRFAGGSLPCVCASAPLPGAVRPPPPSLAPQSTQVPRARRRPPLAPPPPGTADRVRQPGQEESACPCSHPHHAHRGRDGHGQ